MRWRRHLTSKASGKRASSSSDRTLDDAPCLTEALSFAATLASAGSSLDGIPGIYPRETYSIHQRAIKHSSQSHTGKHRLQSLRCMSKRASPRGP